MAFNWKLVPAKYEECLETRKQIAIFHMLRGGKSWPAISKEQGITERNVANMVKRVKDRIIAAGYNQEAGIEIMTPAPFVVERRT
jgi:DNA-binding NarL/FixJ family response regulator